MINNEVICKRYSLVASYYDGGIESFGYYYTEDEAVRKATVLMETNPNIATFEVKINVVRIKTGR